MTGARVARLVMLVEEKPDPPTATYQCGSLVNLPIQMCGRNPVEEQGAESRVAEDRAAIELPHGWAVGLLHGAAWSLRGAGRRGRRTAVGIDSCDRLVEG
jgi:hypothetical protein